MKFLRIGIKDCNDITVSYLTLYLLLLTLSLCFLWQRAAARFPFVQWPCQWSAFVQLARVVSFPVQLNFQKASVKVATSPWLISALVMGYPWTKPSSLHRTVASVSSQPSSHTWDQPFIPLISTVPTLSWSDAWFNLAENTDRILLLVENVHCIWRSQKSGGKMLTYWTFEVYSQG